MGRFMCLLNSALIVIDCVLKTFLSSLQLLRVRKHLFSRKDGNTRCDEISEITTEMLDFLIPSIKSHHLYGNALMMYHEH